MSDFPDYHVGSRSVAVPSESVEGIDATQTDTVASGDEEKVYIRPPSGYLYELLAVRFEVPAVDGATTGEHRLSLKTEKEWILWIKGHTSYDEMLSYEAGWWEVATKREMPSTGGSQTLMTRGARASENNGFLIRYVNATDADQTEDRIYKFSVRKIRVV